MSELGGIVAETLAAIVGSPLVGLLVQALAVAMVVLWLASAWWTYRDLGTRTRDPLAPYLASAGVLLATPMFFLLALLVYRLVRPPYPLSVEDVLALRVAAFAVEADPACPACGRPIGEDWRRCPDCGAVLAVPCESCGRPVGVGWSICAWCAAEVPQVAR